MKKILLEDALILNAIRFTRWCVRHLPLGVCLALGRRVGDLVYFSSKRRDIAYRNLRMIYAGEKSSSEMKSIARGSFQTLGMSTIEMLRIPDMTLTDVERYFKIEGKENFEPYLKLGKGIIFLTGHFGSWEYLNIVSGLSGYPMVALARVQKHPRSDAYLNSLRSSKGSQVIHKGMPIREILRALKNGKIVGILSDQDGGKNGRFVNFFGKLSSTPSGAATFSLRTGSPVFPAFIIREHGAHHRIVVEKPIEIADPSLTPEEAETRILQHFATSLERVVRQAPDQWLWAHRRWKSSPERHVTVLSDGKAGHVQQSMALFDAMRRERQAQGFPVEMVRLNLIEVLFRSAFHKALWKSLGFCFNGRPPFGEELIHWALEPKSAAAIIKSYASVIISCGSSLSLLNLWMKKENSARSVVIMKPDLSTTSFDAVIAPHHDRVPAADNIFTTEGALSRLRPEDLDREGAILAGEAGIDIKGKYLGLLVGGDTPELRFDPALLEETALEVRQFANENKMQVLLTTSRRTPAWAETLLKEIFSQTSLCPVRVIANEVNRPGIVAGILGLSTAVLVSGESISMISEAVASARPVVVFRPCRNTSQKRKYGLQLERWEEQGKLLSSRSAGIAEALRQSMDGAYRINGKKTSETETLLSSVARKVLA